MLAAELSNPIYQAPSDPWYMRILERIMQFLESLSGTALPSSTVWWVVLAFVVFIGLVIVFAGPLRRSRRATSVASVFEDAVISAAEYRDRARSAAAQGDFSLASIELFRAIVKRSEETVLINEQYGRTAREASLAIAAADAALKDEVTWGAALFDSVEYGDEDADASDVARLEELYSSLESKRTPALVSVSHNSAAPPAIGEALGAPARGSISDPRSASSADGTTSASTGADSTGTENNGGDVK